MRPLFIAGLVTLSLVLSGAGCSHSPTSPSSQAVVSSTPAATLRSVTISGNPSLTTVGETSQLAAIATFSDNTTKDVTTATQWSSSNTSVAIVTSTGLVTVVGLGESDIVGIYQSKYFGDLQVKVTPPGTFVVFGRAREPGRSGLPQVQVLETHGQSTLTNSNGEYSLGGLTTAHLSFQKDGYEPVQLDGPINQYNDTALQAIIRVSAGDSVTPLELAPHDVSYMAGTDRCYPCRLIRVVTPTAGTLHLNLRWSAPGTTLNLWANGQRFPGTNQQLTADVSVGAGEVVVYAGMQLPASADGGSTYVPFTLATAIDGGP